MAEAGSQHGRSKDDVLLKQLVESVRELKAVGFSKDHMDDLAGRGRPAGEGLKDEGGEKAETNCEEHTARAVGGERQNEPMDSAVAWTENASPKKVLGALGALRELSVLHSDRLRLWKEALTTSACIFMLAPTGGTDHPHITDYPETNTGSSSDDLSSTFLCVADYIERMLTDFNCIINKLDADITSLAASAVDEKLALSPEPQRDGETPRPEGDSSTSNSHNSLGPDSGHKEGGGGRGAAQSHTEPSHSHMSQDMEKTSHRISSSAECGDATRPTKGLEPKVELDDECVSPTQTDALEVRHNDGREEDGKVYGRANAECITVGLTGPMKDGQSDVPNACYITAPGGVAEVLTCEVADDLSSLVVIGSEELVSRVVRVKVQEGARIRFPVTVVVPFRARYRGGCRDVVVKVVDEERRASYITPIETEGTYGGQKGSFAKVKVYCLGLFAVVSRLRTEHYTIPRRGLSHKLPMDLRVCLDYPPGSFTTPVVAQAMVQPLDANLLSRVRSGSDEYHCIISTSPLLHLTHPSCQPPRTPLTLTLPCPPNPERRRGAGRQVEGERPVVQRASAAALWDQHTLHRVRMLRMLKSSTEISNELLVLLGHREQQWNVLEKVTVRNLQNGLVSFELSENFERLLVVRLLCSMRPCHLTSLAKELEEAVCRHAVSIALQHRRDDPHRVLVVALPSRDLSWELSKLQAQGYARPPEAPPELLMCEGEQLALCFSGNITSTETQNAYERITFHSQRKSRLLLRLTEVDPFGNHSSSHYKGTAVFYKLPRGQLQWQSAATATANATPLSTNLLGEPVCKLSLTLPKKERTVNRPLSAKVKLCKETELSEEEVARLGASLHVRRSSSQLDRSGRSNLPRELLQRQAAATRGGT